MQILPWMTGNGHRAALCSGDDIGADAHVYAPETSRHFLTAESHHEFSFRLMPPLP
jgi:hypothetical protein